MFAVDGFVNTSSPCALAIATTIFVVVDFPAEPEITTTPIAKERRVFASNFGAILLKSNPGKAEPPPGRTRRMAKRTNRPNAIAGR
jgi:hypothetical protein